MNFNPHPSQSPQQHSQAPQPPQPVIQRNPQQVSNEIQRTQPPIPMINPNIQYPRYPQQVPQPKINQKVQNNRRKNQKAPFPQTFPVNPQPSMDFPNPQQMIFLKAQELNPERRELFIELTKDIPNKQQQYFQQLNDLLHKFTDDKAFRYYREPRVPHVYKAIGAIKPTYYLANFQSQKEFKPQLKDRTQDVIYIASYIAYQADINLLKMLNLQANNTNLPPLTFGEPDEAFFFRFGPGDKLPPSIILTMARASYNFLYWLVIQAVRIKSPEEFINEYYSKVKINPARHELPAKCPFCNHFYDVLLMIKEIQRKGDSNCPSCVKRIPINKFIFDNQAISGDNAEKRKMKMKVYEMMREMLMKKNTEFDIQLSESIFNYNPSQITEKSIQNEDENENNLEDLNEYYKFYDASQQ